MGHVLVPGLRHREGLPADSAIGVPVPRISRTPSTCSIDSLPCHATLTHGPVLIRQLQAKST